jgi:isopentenyl-diphosphate delta-isomerase
LKSGLIIIDQDDRALGTMDKLAAHKGGILHRAFSVFVFNSAGQLLLQQRAFDKYHSGGKWTNTCCSHPRPGEPTEAAAHRRLLEEMGMECALNYQFKFTYRAEVGNGLIEHECDHVFFATSDKLPNPNPTEVAGYKYIDMDVLATELQDNPTQYSAWLQICFERVMEQYRQIFKG